MGLPCWHFPKCGDKWIQLLSFIWTLEWWLACDMVVKVTQSCATLCDPMYYTVHVILQARILEWVAFPFSRGSSQPRDQTQGSNPGLLHCRRILCKLSHKGRARILEWVAYPFPRGSSQTRVSCIAGRFFTNWAIRETLLKEGWYYKWKWFNHRFAC